MHLPVPDLQFARDTGVGETRGECGGRSRGTRGARTSRAVVTGRAPHNRWDVCDRSIREGGMVQKRRVDPAEQVPLQSMSRTNVPSVHRCVCILFFVVRAARTVSERGTGCRCEPDHVRPGWTCRSAACSDARPGGVRWPERLGRPTRYCALRPADPTICVLAYRWKRSRVDLPSNRGPMIGATSSARRGSRPSTTDRSWLGHSPLTEGPRWRPTRRRTA